MMSDRFSDFLESVARLREALALEKTDIVRDSAIKRFELCFDLSWKIMQGALRDSGVECATPRECFKKAFEAGFIEHDTRWLDMIQDRNLAVHTYDAGLAQQIYGKLGEYLKLFEQLKKTLPK